MISRDDELTARLRGEFREMAALRLTLPQASRLWQIDSSYATLLEALVRERFLNKAPDGAYIALPSPCNQLKGDLEVILFGA